MGTTSNIDLFKLTEYYNLPIYDVVQKDKLKECEPVNNVYYIINNQSSNIGSGTHWTALFLSKNISFFFDSYGASPSQEIVNYVKNFKSKHFYYNNFIIQDLKSNNCGYFCIGYALFCHRNMKICKDIYEASDQFIHMFDDDTKRNDKILESIFRIYTPSKPLNIVKKLYNQK